MDKAMNLIRRRSQQSITHFTIIALSLLASSCGSGGNSGTGSGDFQINNVSLAPNSVWFINRAITLE
jgi:hypothetical protein